MSLQVVLTLEAREDVQRLPPGLQSRILDKLEWMGQNAELLQHRVLQGKEWSGCFKYRIGDYRILYQLDWTAERMVVLKVGHRREIYR